ncbi:MULTISPECIES: CHAP domain-containing protein [Paraburkholderia]|uniref:CHAP domain-containing protein n=1 Tax=Paraburkholderia TaxID=1822464 RepID=UPI002AB7A703|nr:MULTISPECIES: CHAP domain-containing protein [Paraburkholderia]
MPAFDGTVLVPGSTATASIAAVQAQLTARGYASGTNGNFDAAMESAVKLFQAQHCDESGLPLKVDGQIGVHTWNALFGATPVDVQPLVPLLAQAIAVASSQVGQMEVPHASNRGPMVDQYLTSTGVSLSGTTDSRAWCMCFVYWSFLQAARQLNRSTPLPKTGGCINHWQLAGNRDNVTRVTAASALKNRALVQPGMIFILDFGSGLGHTGIVETLLPGGGLQTIEGNTNTDGSRSGVGVFRLTRRKLTDAALVGFVDYSHA